MKRNDNVIAIPIYKLRYTELIDGIKNDIDLYKDKYDIILFSQSNDENKDLYNKYKTDYIDVIELDVKNIAEKRRLMYDKCIELGYNKMFQIDDDVKYGGKMIDETTKRATSNSYKAKNIHFSRLLDELLLRMNEYDAGMACFKSTVYLFTGKPNLIKINKSLCPAQFILLDLKKLYKNDITYSDINFTFSEDLRLALDVLKKGITIISLDYMTFSLNNSNFDEKRKNSTIFTDLYEEQKLWLRGNYLFNIPLRLNRHDDLRMIIKWEKYFNTEDLPKLTKPEDIDIHNIIKEYIETNGDVDNMLVDKVMEKLKYYKDLKNKNK